MHNPTRRVVDEDLMQGLFVTGARRAPCPSWDRRHACDYSWDCLWAKLASSRVHFDNENEAVYLRLEFDGQPPYRPSTPIKHDGQFRIVLDQVLSFCQDWIANAADAREVTLYWDIRSRYDNPSETASSEQQDTTLSRTRATTRKLLGGDKDDVDDKDDSNDNDNDVIFVSAGPVEHAADVDLLINSPDDAAG
ncbi:LOW QUALITY PROTEIN: reverse transcriptase [Colletotrichum tofieldiae]|nr:LOW QUALITY PROTEIN: reverse transcriptase [Colletotrichum tofieldiae]GKT68906.1 LOW QUALITY PROTEIN: reverse transcriptase [Colletotrichum tofieldiae]